MAETDSSSSSNAEEVVSSSPASASASLVSMAENFQRSAIESARTVQHTSSTQFRTFQLQLQAYILHFFLDEGCLLAAAYQMWSSILRALEYLEGIIYQVQELEGCKEWCYLLVVLLEMGQPNYDVVDFGDCSSDSYNFLPEAVSHYRTYEDAFVNKVKDGLMVARENPAIGVGFAVSAALLVMRAPRRFLFRNTLGRFQSEETRYASAEKNVKNLNLSVDLLKKESIKLLQRTSLAEKEMKYGHNELMNTGAQLQRLAKSSYKVEARATDLIDRLRDIPSREALALRAEASL
ncbi:hypothetical protein L195_g002958 [Trifolium pratense]|uniref:Uncharacterized protein n=1 Tax=Trifolium pratense TaxID=57577 RepID=A0A2K3NTZ4_TRIPR|nr:hypothetical protein L195_g002958 [Trifolium pratense]